MSTARTIVKIGIGLGIVGVIAGIYALYRQQLYYAMQYCYKIYKISPKKFTKDAIEIDVTIKILNRSSFALQINSYDFDLFINNNFITNVKSEAINSIAQNSVSYIKANISVNPSNILKADLLASLLVYYLTDQSKIIIRVKGELAAKANFINIKKLPIDYTDNLKSLMTVDPKAESEKMVCPKDF
jgi:LEA14-like dessication related protein